MQQRILNSSKQQQPKRPIGSSWLWKEKYRLSSTRCSDLLGWLQQSIWRKFWHFLFRTYGEWRCSFALCCSLRFFLFKKLGCVINSKAIYTRRRRMALGFNGQNKKQWTLECLPKSRTFPF